MEKHKFEQSKEGVEVEQEKFSKAIIRINVFRHGEKEKDPSKNDNKVRLTPAGRKYASEQSEPINHRQAVAFGSRRERAQETAGHVMAGEHPEITGEETLEELREKLDKELRTTGSKIGIDDRLNFELDADSDYGKEAYKAFNEGWYLKFVVEESDRVARETGDEESSTYSRDAANIAGIVKKYIDIYPRFRKLVEDPSKSYSNAMERLLGTHQGVSEAFLAKVIEKTEDVEERDKFVKALGNQGFGFVEGFDMEIFDNGDEPAIDIRYRKKDKDGKVIFEFAKIVPISLIEEIIKEGGK